MENGSWTVGGAEESGGRYVTVRARTIETEATERQTNAKERERREKHRQEVGAFAGCGRPAVGRGRDSRRRLERRRETVEAMRSLTAVGTGGGRGRSSFNTQDQSRGERPRSAAFASLYLVPPPHSYTLENAPFLYAPPKIEGEKGKKKYQKKVRRVRWSPAKDRGGLDERTGAAPASFASVDGKPVASRFRRSVRFLASLLPFRPDVFPSGGRIPSRPFPFLCSDISPSPTEDRSPTRRWWTASTVVVYYGQRGIGRAEAKEGERKIHEETGEREEKPACVLVPSSLIEHAPFCRSAKRYGGE